MTKDSTTTHIVSLSQPAFFAILTSSLEAYKVSHSGAPSGIPHVPVETCGNLWGYQSKTVRKESVLHVSLADVDTSATRTPSHVVSLDQALQLKKDFADTYFPELEYLGDFHSHPYETKDVKTELAVERKTLQERSSADTAWVKDIQKTESTHRLSLITTIFERDNPVARQEGHVNGDRSCLRFRYDSMTVWIKVYVFQMSQMDRKHRKVACKKVAVVCPSIGVHVGTLNV